MGIIILIVKSGWSSAVQNVWNIVFLLKLDVTGPKFDLTKLCLPLQSFVYSAEHTGMP